MATLGPSRAKKTRGGATDDDVAPGNQRGYFLQPPPSRKTRLEIGRRGKFGFCALLFVPVLAGVPGDVIAKHPLLRVQMNAPQGQRASRVCSASSPLLAPKGAFANVRSRATEGLSQKGH